jgi:cell shape-determining protein MreC
MTYLVRNDAHGRRMKKLRSTLLGTLIFLVFLSILHLFAPRLLPSILYTFVEPLWKYGSDAPVSAGESREELFSEIGRLTLELDQLSGIASSSALIIEENILLKRILGRDLSTSTISNQIDGVLAVVLKKPPYTPYDSLIIDTGQSLGIEKGDIVSAPGGIPIGSISEVYSNTSKVRLFSAPGETHEVLIGASSTMITAIGRGAGVYEASVPRNLGIEEGDLVSLPAINPLFVGRVNGLVSDPADPFTTVLFSAPVNIYELRFVIVLNK